ncbi:hypothetical protein [Nocardia sp. NPDC059239]
MGCQVNIASDAISAGLSLTATFTQNQTPSKLDIADEALECRSLRP